MTTDSVRTATCATALMIALAVLPASSPAQTTAGGGKTATAPAGPPPDWERTKARMRELTLVGEDLKAIAIVEPIVAAHPRFAEGHARLGGAHEGAARALARTDRALAAKHFELAATHLRRAFELGGGEYPDTTIRGLIDLYEYALPSAEKWKATVLDALARYPAEPVSQWYGTELVIREGRIADLDGAFRRARVALPAGEPRLEYASLLVALAARNVPPAARTAVVREALALADDAVKGSPSDRAVKRKADGVREDVARLPPK